MTTRRLPRGLAPPRGLIGLLGLFAMSRGPSVEPAEGRIDADVLSQHAAEAATGEGALEAQQPRAGVHAPAGHRSSRSQPPRDRPEPHELRLRCLASTAGAGPCGDVLTPQEPRPPAGTAPPRPAQPE